LGKEGGKEGLKVLALTRLVRGNSMKVMSRPRTGDEDLLPRVIDSGESGPRARTSSWLDSSEEKLLRKRPVACVKNCNSTAEDWLSSYYVELQHEIT
jgi:hypothetical protein